MKSIFNKITIGLLAATLSVGPATAAYVPAAKATQEQTTDAATTSQAMTIAKAKEQWKSMSRAERRQKTREFRKALRNAADDISENTLLLVIVAILLPWLAVLLHQGEFNSKVLIALILWLLFYIPGLIYALIVIFGD